jgi:hypothetical protein
MSRSIEFRSQTKIFSRGKQKIFHGKFQSKEISNRWTCFLNRFSLFCLPRKLTIFDVTIKFNYAIKLHLIAKSVACGTGFCDGDWLNEINGLLSIPACAIHVVLFLSSSFPSSSDDAGDSYIIKRVACKFNSKYLHFHLLHCPQGSSCQSLNFPPCVLDVVGDLRTFKRALSLI